MGQSLTYAITTVSETTSSITKNLKITYNTSVGVTDSSNTFGVTGDWGTYSGSPSISIPFGGGSQLIYEYSLVFSKTYGSTATKSFASLSGINEWGGATITTSGSTTVPARAYDAPAAPTGVTGTRVSDTQHTLAWTTNATTAAPYAGQYVLRSANGGAYATIATVSGSATSYTDTTTSAGNKYTYKVAATNATATTLSVASAAVYTTPGAPTGAAATKNTSNNIVVTWANAPPFTEYSTEVWESQDGGAYALLATVGTGVATYPHTSPSTSVTHAYKVLHRTSSGTPLYSAFSSPTATISLVSPPSAPSNLAPSGTPQDASAGITFTWTHNPTDSSPQSAFQIEHRLAGAGSWTTVTAVTSTLSSWTLPGGTYANGVDVEWHVRTYGESVTPSAYSATALFAASSAPTATISSPVDAGTVVTSLPILTWAYYDAEGTAQSQWEAELLDASGVSIQVRTASTTATTVSFTTALEDATTYTMRVKVRDGAGSWSAWDSVTFVTDFLPPANVTITPVFDEVHGWMTLTLEADGYSPGVTEPIVAVDVERRRDGGEWVSVALGLSGSAVVTDKAPVTAGLNEYRAIVYSALPSTAIMATVAATVTASRWAYLSTGTGFGDVARLYGNLQINPTDGISRALHQFAGRPLPVEFAGIAQASSVAVSGLLDSDSSTLADFKARALARTICLLRDPTGRVLFGSLSPIAGAQDWTELATVSFTVTAVDYEG